MKLTGYVFLLISIVGCSKTESFDPDQLSSEERSRLMRGVIRYAGKLPPRVNSGAQFSSEHDMFYEEQLRDAILENVYKKDGYYYFLISQSAPSIVTKRHATGGRIKFSGEATVEDYEEVFRTWKLVPETLKIRSAVLFKKMVNGEDLRPYYAKTTGTDYIEFPDERTFFSKQERKWMVK